MLDKFNIQSSVSIKIKRVEDEKTNRDVKTVDNQSTENKRRLFRRLFSKKSSKDND